MKRAREYYDEFSLRYDTGRDRGYHALVDELEAGLVAAYGAGGRILEAGCGTGLILERLRGKCSSCVGADLSRGMLLRARERGFTVLQSDVTALPFKDAVFDVTYSFKVLPHVPGLAQALGELVRVTRPGGYVLAEFYNPLSLRWLVRTLKGPTKISSESTDREVYTRYLRWKEIMGSIPAGCRLAAVRGIRIYTPHPVMLSFPVVGPVLRLMETRCCDGPLRRFAGFVILVLQRSD